MMACSRRQASVNLIVCGPAAWRARSTSSSLLVARDVCVGVRLGLPDAVPRVDGGACLPGVPGCEAGVRFVDVRRDQPE